MNIEIKNLINCVADNDVQNAKKVIKRIIENNKTEIDKPFLNSIKNKIETQSLNFMELPYDLKGILKVEDVSVSFNEKRYYLTDSENEIYKHISSIKNINSKLDEMGISYLNSVLLYGESGTGKTLFGRYVAYKLGLPFAYLNFSSCVNSYLGSTQKNIEKVFDYVSKMKCVFMIDEIDAIGLERGQKNDVGEMSRIVISVMQALDLFRNDTIVIGATNRIDMIDKALSRRFAIKHEVKPLNEKQTKELIIQYLSDINIEYDMENVENYSKKCNKQSQIVNNIIQSIIITLTENKKFEMQI